jgi:hypothetical protein
MSARQLVRLASFLALATILWGCPSSGTYTGDVAGSEEVTDVTGELPEVIIENPPCLANQDCPQGQLCDGKHHVCVDCQRDEECAQGEVCRDGRCGVPAGCDATGYCAVGYCDLATGLCVACLSDLHCPEGYVCQAGECQLGETPCAGHGDCPPGLVCDTGSGLCVECLSAGDCGQDEYCEDNLCSPILCPAGARQCVGSVVMGCRTDGSGWAVLEECAEGVPCVNGACATTCEPKCAGKQCGDDGCQGSCGSCPEGQECSNSGQCLGGFLTPCADGAECASGFCVPYKEGKTVCTVFCDGPCPADRWSCKQVDEARPDLVYVCAWDPDCKEQCEGKQCGDDGCGGLCGLCDQGWSCQDFRCVPCQASCFLPDGQVKECGPDGCGGSCGQCAEGCGCYNGRCEGHCQDTCQGKVCGPDGLGGWCGDCPWGYQCDWSGQCVPECTDTCEGKKCGYTKCGEFCGDCPAGWACEQNQCQAVCLPSCAGKQCGDNGCGGSCGTCQPGVTFCEDGQCVEPKTCKEYYDCLLQCGAASPDPLQCLGVCEVDSQSEAGQRLYSLITCALQQCGMNYDFQCLQQALMGACQQDYYACIKCEPTCQGIACGPDGCGGVCGWCPYGTDCQGGQCKPVCTPSCATSSGAPKQCGSDGCGGMCGVCPADLQCNEAGQCKPVCVPSCAGKECGPDGCGGQCGKCDAGCTCSSQGLCLGDCHDWCQGKECGSDGHGGWCGDCPLGYSCQNGKCQGGCVASCAGKQCGGDGCGGSCGQCGPDAFCNSAFKCQPLCTPACLGKACGPDGCGGQCGACSADEYCQSAQCHPFISCKDLVDCFNNCGDDQCMYDCYMTASPPAQQQFDEFQWCLIEVCGENGSDQCYTQAFYNQCKDLYYSCLSCTPNCIGKQCGVDGCGGTCGTCPAGSSCDAYGYCGCVPSCVGPNGQWRECGPNGCGGSCGSCSATEVCSAQGQCVGTCTPQCVTASGQKKSCGPDGCGGSCGSCPSGQKCTDQGTCKGECQPSCVTDAGFKKECGDDGCGGQCGWCQPGYQCVAGVCSEPCLPQCVGKQCGSDGCGASCGQCAQGFFCDVSGKCQLLCQPKCSGKECGPDSCGGACGYCAYDENCVGGQCLPFVSCSDLMNCEWACPDNDQACHDACWQQASPAARQQWMSLWLCITNSCGQDPAGACVAKAFNAECKQEYYSCLNCTPNCQGKQCGDDGCGGTCGTCPAGVTCDTNWGLCACQPKCAGKECGPDGCGGACGTCPAGEVCISQGVCICLPQCGDKQCGADGCGGQCGTCPTGYQCQGGWCVGGCEPTCYSPDGMWKQCGDDGCGGSCGECPPGLACTPWGTCEYTPTDGCTPHQTPGCGGCSCEKEVCSMDPYCCQGAWDDMCVQECYQVGGCGHQCEPTCDQMECGYDCNGKYCGECWEGAQCVGGYCQPWCEPNCWNKQCGDDGCGGSCGYCPPGLSCNANGQCQPAGGTTCQQIVDCAANQCLAWGNPDINCIQGCMQGASQVAQQEFAQLVQCVVQQCGYQTTVDCFWKAAKGACVQQYMTCLN